MSESFEITDVAQVVAAAISSATWQECSVADVKRWGGTESALLNLQPVSVRRNKIDRRGIQIDYAFEVSFMATGENATLIKDQVLAAIEDYFLRSPRVVGQVGGADVEVIFQKLVYSSETNIINGGVIEGYFSSADLDKNDDLVQAAMLYFSAWYEVT